MQRCTVGPWRRGFSDDEDDRGYGFDPWAHDMHRAHGSSHGYGYGGGFPPAAAWPPRLPTCTVCREAPADCESVVPSRTEQWANKALCSGGTAHRFCRGCLAAWVESHLSDEASKIRCPHPGCTAVMTQEDVGRACPQLHGAMVALMVRAFAGRAVYLAGDGDGDGGVRRWAEESGARSCPRCKVLVERSYGCADMVCVCGASFSYRDGTCSDCRRTDCACATHELGAGAAARVYVACGARHAGAHHHANPYDDPRDGPHGGPYDGPQRTRRGLDLELGLGLDLPQAGHRCYGDRACACGAPRCTHDNGRAGAVDVCPSAVFADGVNHAAPGICATCGCACPGARLDSAARLRTCLGLVTAAIVPCQQCVGLWQRFASQPPPPPPPCTTCGCSAEVDGDGERICFCSTCADTGCNATHGRMTCYGDAACGCCNADHVLGQRMADEFEFRPRDGCMVCGCQWAPPNADQGLAVPNPTPHVEPDAFKDRPHGRAPPACGCDTCHEGCCHVAAAAPLGRTAQSLE